MDHPLRAVVTGASSGIGAATVRRLRARGWSVLAVARRADRLAALAAETGCDVLTADLTRAGDVERVADAAVQRGPVHALVNNAGGAVGADAVADADPADWAAMYDVNVLATLRVTQALLPSLLASGRGDVLVLSSTAARTAYEGGGGYVAAKAGESAIAATLRLELVGQPVRVIEIAPGMVATEEFSLNRFGGDRARADAVYAGVAHPPERRRRRRLHRVDPHPTPPREHRPARGAAHRPGRPAQGRPGRLTRLRRRRPRGWSGPGGDGAH